jgi:hypothetical protein
MTTCYFRSLSYGKGSTEPLKDLPKITTTEAWDGKDGQVRTMLFVVIMFHLRSTVIKVFL